MSEEKTIYVIYLDENGKETSRRPKGRGKPPKERDAEGNFIVRAKPTTGARKTEPVKTEKPVKTEATEAPEAPESPKEQPKPEEAYAQKELPEHPSIRTKHIDLPYASQAVFERLLSVVLPLRKEETETEITIYGPMLLNDPLIDEDVFVKGSLYEKFVLAKTVHEVRVWRMGNMTDIPHFVLKMAE
jgi:hypothetical protein